MHYVEPCLLRPYLSFLKHNAFRSLILGVLTESESVILVQFITILRYYYY
jgi:hypothetical protein